MLSPIDSPRLRYAHRGDCLFVFSTLFTPKAKRGWFIRQLAEIDRVSQFYDSTTPGKAKTHTPLPKQIARQFWSVRPTGL